MNKTSSLTRKTKKAEPDPSPPAEKKPDVVDDFMFRATDYVYRKRKIFISLAVIVVVLLTSAYGAFEFSRYREELRNRELYKIERLIYDSFLTEEERFEKAMPMLNDFMEKHSRTTQQRLALFYRANLHHKLNNSQKAEEDLKTLLLSLGETSSLSAIAGIYLANILWDQNKNQEAIKTLESLNNENMAEIILMELAEKHLSANRNQEARQTLETLLKDFPNTRYRAKITRILKVI